MPVTERDNVVTFKGNPVTLVGQPVEEGQKAPDVQLVGTDMSAKSISDLGDKIKIIAAVPSLDTAVCDKEIQRFNQEATSLSDDVVVVCVSVDTPMAQKRWCGDKGVERVEALSDFKDHSFGQQFGIRIKELGLLARSIFVLDRDNTVRYMQIVPEIAEEPAYDAALEAARKLA